MKSLSVNCLTFKGSTPEPYKDNLCLFRALTLHLHGNHRLEEESSNFFNLLLEKTDGTDPANFRSVQIKAFAAVRDFVRQIFS